MNDLKNALRRTLISHFRVKDTLDDDTELFSSGKIDSLSVLELVNFVEGEIGCSIAPNEITLENFDTINRIVSYAQKIAAKRACS